MSIVITNCGEVDPTGDYDDGGERNYTLAIHGEILVRFTHFRRDGLIRCLEKAIIALESSDV